MEEQNPNFGYNDVDDQYLELCREIIEYGTYKPAARENMPGTKELFHRSMRFDLSKGFPLLTTKKIFTKGMIYELLWFLRGDTNIRYLHENNVTKFWHQDVYKRFVKTFKADKSNLGGEPIDFANWCELLTNNKLLNGYVTDAGPIYGHQWRNFGGKVDQIKNLLDSIINTPNSRYQVVSAWNPTEMSEMSLPACHVYFQCNVREGKLDLSIIQRSCDMALGVPINIASYALLLHILARLANLEVGELVWTGMSCHIYENHIDQMSEQIDRNLYALPALQIDSTKWQKYTGSNLQLVIESIDYDNFQFENYDHWPEIKYELSTGLFKSAK